ncbi:MAG: hypothetical protein Q8O19_04925 [Rectinemataceae bacterium]|nr:hypothetical protein [Rectinemataceae bacterium]
MIETTRGKSPDNLSPPITTTITKKGNSPKGALIGMALGIIVEVYLQGISKNSPSPQPDAED